MQLTIHNKDLYSKEFVFGYLRRYIYELFIKHNDPIRFKVIDKEFGIDCLEAVKYALANLQVSETTNSYLISINKNLRYKNANLDSLINLITYGNRSCKGYTLVYDIFNYIANNLDIIYKE